MKLATIQRGSEERLALVRDNDVLDLTLAAHLAGKTSLSDAYRGVLSAVSTTPRPNPFADMQALIEAWAVVGSDVFAAVGELSQLQDDGKLPPAQELPVLDEADATLLAPLPRPASIRDGYAFRQHVATMRKNRGMEMVPEFDQFPVFYHSNHHCVVGPGEVRVRQRHLENLDYELELAVVVGKRVRDLTVAQADEAIFGCCIWNDFSAREWQREEMKLSLGPAKGKDFANALGPYLVPREMLSEHTTQTPNGAQYNLGMKAWVNGELLSDANAGTMDWTFAQILERISYGNDLMPGDVIGSGTVGTGCLAELNSSKITDNLWLQPGDSVALEIEELGRLENTIVLYEP